MKRRKKKVNRAIATLRRLQEEEKKK